MDGPANHGGVRYFADLPDPRAHNVRHRLPDLLVIALCATLCGADGWDDFEDFARAKAKWFGSFLDLEHGVPSADTFRRVFSRLDPEAFERCFLDWMQAVAELSEGKLVAIDGKSIRRSFERGWDKIGMPPPESRSAPSPSTTSGGGQVLTQFKTDGKGNELVAIEQLLGLLDLQGATVSIDAIGTQKAIARQIVDAGGQYVLALKENQKSLHQAVRKELDDMIRNREAALLHVQQEALPRLLALAVAIGPALAGLGSRVKTFTNRQAGHVLPDLDSESVKGH